MGGRIAHTMQLLLEASLSHVFKRCSSITDVAAVADMCFELPQPGAAVLMSFFLKYSGRPDNFIFELNKEFWYFQNPLEDLLRAFHFWNEFCRCIGNYPD